VLIHDERVGQATHILSRMVRISVMCIIIFVNARVNMRYATDRRTAAAVIRSSRYAVLL